MKKEEDLKIKVPKPILEFSYYILPAIVPYVRSAGYSDIGDTRGKGDLQDTVATLTLWSFLTIGCKKKAMLDLCSGVGDYKDIVLFIDGEETFWNIKASATHPWREGLNILLKKEEINKPMYGYIQAFVHLEGKEPHVHYAGYAETASPLFSKHKKITSLPKTKDYAGMKIPLNEADSVKSLIPRLDDRPDAKKAPQNAMGHIGSYVKNIFRYIKF